MPVSRCLTREEARRFYDRLGARQDTQRFYENRALSTLIARSAFGKAHTVFEFGCGTGRLAERLLLRHLPGDARYAAADLSGTMVGLARRRLEAFGPRVTVAQTDGAPRCPLPDRSVDRFVSTYVLDLLPEGDIRAVVAEAGRVLAEGGLLCLVGLTPGRGPWSRAVTALWRRVHARRPAWVGGCRPLELTAFLPHADWEIRYWQVVAPFGVASEVVVAERRGAA